MAKINKIICPLMGGECIEGGTAVVEDGKSEIHACRFWVKVAGKDPQSSKEFEHWDCAHAWMPVLMIENSQMQRQTGAAVESFRNEMVKANVASQEAVMLAAGLVNGQVLKIGGN